MTHGLVEQQTDSELVESAQAGDQDAFAVLYGRYFDPVYDFVLRMTRNREEAADLAQDTFIKAMNSLPGLQKGTSFKSWLFTIARNSTLNRLERASRTRPLAFEDDDGDEVTMDVVDSDRMGSPEEAAEASAMGSLVWEAAAGLDPKQLTLLDLHLRQGLESAEIADVMGVTRNNGYVMLNRLKKAVEESIGAFIMLHDGRKHCDALDTALADAGIDAMSPQTRKFIERHVAQCPRCEERRKKMVSPLAIFGAFAPVAAPAGLKDSVLAELSRQWPGPPDTGSGMSGGGGVTPPPPAGPVPLGSSGGAGGYSNRGALLRSVVLGAGAMAAVLGALLFLPASPFALLEGGEPEPPAAPLLTDTPTPVDTSGAVSPAVGEPETPGADDDDSPGDGTPGAEDETTTPSATATDEDGEPETPAPPTPDGGSGNDAEQPTATAPPPATSTATEPPTSTPRPTNTRPPTPTTPPCVPQVDANVDSVNFGRSLDSTSVRVLNTAPCATDARLNVTSGSSWLGVSPGSASISANGTLDVNLTADRGALPPGRSRGAVTITAANGQTVTVSAVIDAPQPTPTATPVPDTASPGIASIEVRCSRSANGIQIGLTVAAGDNTSVSRVQYSDGNVTIGLGFNGRTWVGSAEYSPSANFHRIRAWDPAGNRAERNFAPSPNAGCP